MTTSTTIQLTTLRLQLGRPLRTGEAPALRGFFGNKLEAVAFDNMQRHGR